MNNTFSNKNNVNDSAEIDKFNSLSQQWWNPKGPLKTLHDINPLRINYITEQVPLSALKMAELLSEIKIGSRVVEPIAKILKKKKEPKMLEEQIRDSVPCDVETEEDKNEEF